MSGLTRVSLRERKDPLTDLNALNKVGQAATKAAKDKAFAQGVSITIAKEGTVYRLHPDGREEVIKRIKAQDNFPSLQDDLCRV